MRPGEATRIILTLLAVGGLGSACSSVPPYDSGRQGLLDRLSELDQRPRRLPSKPDGQVVSNAELSERRLAEIRQVAGGWNWPLQSVSVTSPFGKRGRKFHEGIDLKARSGTPIHAAQTGTVVYADRRIRGYGKMIVIQHPSGLSTVYAHNSRLLVKKGQKVKRGERIALSGATGRTSGPHLHFEVRDGVAAVNPDLILPARPVRAERRAARTQKVALQN